MQDRLMLIRDRFNSLVHGSPGSIDDALVAQVIEFLRMEHEAWIADYNFCIASQTDLDNTKHTLKARSEVGLPCVKKAAPLYLRKRRDSKTV